MLGSRSLKPAAFEDIQFPPVANEMRGRTILNANQLLDDTNHLFITTQLHNINRQFSRTFSSHHLASEGRILNINKPFNTNYTVNTTQFHKTDELLYKREFLYGELSWEKFS